MDELRKVARLLVVTYHLWQMFRFIIFDITVTVQPFFWLVMAFLSRKLYADSLQEVAYLLLFLAAGFISILVHELGHALTSKHYGQDRKILLHAMGGLAIYTGGRHLSRRQDFIMTAAGPGYQIVLGLLAYALFHYFPQMNQNGGYFLSALATISIIWAVLNLLPILPMDGGRLVEAALGPAHRRTALLISCITGVVICIVSFTLVYLPILGIIVGMFAFQSFKALKEPSWR